MLVFVDLSFTVRTLALAVFPCISQVNTANVKSFSTVQSPDINTAFGSLELEAGAGML